MKDEDAARLLELLESGSTAGLAADERRALGEAERGRRLLEQAGEVPDPGGLYWRRFGARVQQALPRSRRALPGPWWVAAAAAVLAVSVSVSRGPAAPEPPGWRALPEDDTALQVLAGLGADAQALEPETACAVEECVLDLDDDQSRRLASLLREELDAEIEGREL